MHCLIKSHYCTISIRNLDANCYVVTREIGVQCVFCVSVVSMISVVLFSALIIPVRAFLSFLFPSVSTPARQQTADPLTRLITGITGEGKRLLPYNPIQLKYRLLSVRKFDSLAQQMVT